MVWLELAIGASVFRLRLRTCRTSRSQPPEAMHGGSSRRQTTINRQVIENMGAGSGDQLQRLLVEAIDGWLWKRRLRFADGSSKLLDRPGDLVRRDDGWRSEKKVVPGDAVDAALHRIDEHAALQRGGADTAGEILLRREGTLADFVRDELHSPEQPNSAHVSYRSFIAQAFECLLESSGGRAGQAGGGGFDQPVLLQMS